MEENKLENHLSLEKKFDLAKFKSEISKANREQAIEMAIKIYGLMLSKDEFLSKMLKGESWI